MSQTAILSVGANTATNAVTGSAVTYYGTWGGSIFVASGNQTEANAQSKNRGASTLQNVYAQVPTNLRLTNSTFTSRINTAAGNISITILSSTTGLVSDTTHSDSLADGDLYNYAVTTGSGSANLGISGISAQLVASSQCFKQLLAFQSATVNFSNTTANYGATAGSSNSNSSENPKQLMSMESATLSNLQVYVSTSSTGAPTVKSRVNGVTVNQTVTLTASTVAIFEDTTHTDSIVNTDLFNVVTGTATTTRTIAFYGYKYLGSTTDRSPIYGGSVQVAGSAATNFWPFGYCSKTTTESQTQLPMAASGTASGLYISINPNTVGTNQNFQFRINGANGNQVAVVTANTTGVFTDGTHSDTVVAGDLVNASTGSGFTTTVSAQNYGFLFTVSSAVAANNAQPLLGVL